MIRALIFDLDGTLVKTERLKGVAYAKALQRPATLSNRFGGHAVKRTVT